MEFVLKGFDQAGSVRRFTFDGVGRDRSRSTVVVSVDLSLLREYGISVQSLPLLCRQRLDLSDATELASGAIAITPGDMAAVRNAARVVADQKITRRAPARSSSVGKAWR